MRKLVMLCLEDFEKYALENLDKSARGYYRSGANHEETLRENRKAFGRLRIRPRLLRDVSRRCLDTTVLGLPMKFPIGVAPTAMQRLAHPDGETATARACQDLGTVMILSTIATSSAKEVAAVAPNCVKWFQLYVYKDRSLTMQLVRKAEAAAFQAIVLTIDAPFFGRRFADIRNNFSLPSHLRMANFDEGSTESDSIRTVREASSGINQYVSSQFDVTLTWSDVDWLRTVTDLPIVIKGVLTAEDALLAVDHGAAAIMVSNHGGRQLDGVPATIEALPEVARAVAGRCEVYMDGGVRTGTDVLKCMALGARAVFVGRPVLWGLCYNGVEGVKDVLTILRDELDTAMALSGCSTADQIDKSLVVHRDYYKQFLR